MKHCGLPYDETWVNWSEDMIAEGFDKKCSDLLVLCAERPPFNEFEMKDLIENILDQLSLDSRDKESVIRDYLIFLRSQVLEREIKLMEALREIVDINNELGMNDSLHDFYLFYYAKDELENEGVQFYINNKSAKQINKTIYDYFENWQPEMFKLDEK
tara:strand:- start:61 stop:534 length:474 start_codon:yes stop_codon:yes gene_type:complete